MMFMCPPIRHATDVHLFHLKVNAIFHASNCLIGFVHTLVVDCVEEGE